MFTALRNSIARRFARRPVDRAAHRLYVTAVEAARVPALFEDGGVADSLDGRFDMIALHLALVTQRLRQAGPADQDRADREAAGELETRLLEVHFSDMDQALREMGVGDLGVGKKVKAMARAVMGRVKAYGEAFETLDRSGDKAPLEQALLRNVYRGEAPGAGKVAWLADYVVRQHRALGQQSLEAVLAGEARFAALETAAP